VATGRSDFPNQLNNSLGFPAIFRGTLDVRARTITDGMGIAAAFELAKAAQERGISASSILPGMDEWEVYPRVATATAMKAQEEGVARLAKSAEQVYQEARAVIQRARDATHVLMREGVIPPAPECA
jgi:malate dehydrogenase (oxaloacetate-decarboxylating)